MESDLKKPAIRYKGFEGSVKYSPEDSLYCGILLHVPDLIAYQGETLEKLVEDFKTSIEVYRHTLVKLKRPEIFVAAGSINDLISRAMELEDEVWSYPLPPESEWFYEIEVKHLDKSLMIYHSAFLRHAFIRKQKGILIFPEHNTIAGFFVDDLEYVKVTRRGKKGKGRSKYVINNKNKTWKELE